MSKFSFVEKTSDLFQSFKDSGRLTFVSTVTAFDELKSRFPQMFRRREQPLIELAPWKACALLRDFKGWDIDEYRAKRGKDEGEAAFFLEAQLSAPPKVLKHNLFMFNGAALLFQGATNNGTATANVGFPGVTLLTNSNSYLYVADGNPTAITGTIAATNGSGTVTTTSGSSGLAIGAQLVITGDTSSQVYLITAGSGTSWTISPVFGGTNISGATAGTFAAPSHSNTNFSGSGGTNVANQVADSTFPSCPTAAQFNTISAATNATPIVLTVSGADISANDICQVVEVLGNTAANGVWVANPASASSISLQGSVGSGSYTSGGLVTRRSVLTMQSTFGATAAVFPWQLWSFFNGNSPNKIMLNWRAVGMGSKSSGTSTSLKVGIGIG